MTTITYLGKSYTCTTALKGSDYIRLLDAEGTLIATFDGISDFSGFSISGDSWTTPTAEDNCHLAVVKDDGTMGKGAPRSCDIEKVYHSVEDIGCTASSTATEVFKALPHRSVLMTQLNEFTDESWAKSSLEEPTGFLVIRKP